MLVLSRKKGESILIGDHIEISILEVLSDGVKIGISAPKEVGILRKELYLSVENMNKSAQTSDLSDTELLRQLEQLKK